MNRSIMRVLTLALLATIATAQTCSPTRSSGVVQPLTQCVFQSGTESYDFTPLSQIDLYGVFNGRQYAYRMCGSVQDPLCAANTSACAFNDDRSVCDFADSTTSLISTTDTFHQMRYIGDVPNLGVSITAITPGPFCSNGQNHTVITNIYCSGPNIPSRLESVSQINVGCLCETKISFYSSLACPRSMNVTAPVAPVVTYPPTALPCTLGQFGVDLRSQFANDIRFYSALRGESYVLNLCGAVQDVGCSRVAGAAAAACVIPRCLNSSATALMFRYQTPTWQYTNAVNNSNGYTMVNYNDVSNILIIRLTCDPNATQAFVVQVNMPAPGAREFIMRSSLVCVNESALALATPQCTSGCCGMGTDFSALKNVEVIGYTDSGRGMPWGFTMCGSLRSDCNGAMACSKPSCSISAGALPLSYWKGQDQDIYWSYVNGLDFTGGLRMMTTNGDQYNDSGSPRRTIVTFHCDPLAFVPRAADAVEYPSGTYQISIYTTAVCAAPRYLGGAANTGNRNTTANSIVVAPAKPVFGCQYAGYDFSPLASNDFEARIYPYIFHTRICGAQTNPQCTSGGNQDVSICQMDYSCYNSPGGQWIVSLWNPYLAQWGFVGDDWRNGVSQRMMTGDYCAGGVPRSIVYNFVCDPAAVIPYQDQGFESPGSYICNYFMRIRTNIVCTPPPNGPMGNGNWTMESSSTGSKWSYQKFNSGFANHPSFHWAAVVVIMLVGLI